MDFVGCIMAVHKKNSILPVNQCKWSKQTFFHYHGHRDNFKAHFKTESLTIFDLLGDAFSALCETWLSCNRKDLPVPAMYWNIAFLCSKQNHYYYTDKCLSYLTLGVDVAVLRFTILRRDYNLTRK